jgi:hypothetical protein
MASFSSLRIDPKKDVEGVWFDYHKGIRLRIARHDNPKFTEAMRIMLKPHQHSIDSKTMSEETAGKITRQAVAKHILVGWENVTDDDGTPVPYSYETALTYLSDPNLRDFLNDVLTFSKHAEAFREQRLETIAGN